MTAQAAITAAIDAKFIDPIVLTLAESKTATTDYVNVFTARRFVPDRLASGEVPIHGNRVIVRLACKEETNLDVLRPRVTAALEDVILPGGYGPFAFESETFIDPDEASATDWYLSEITWTF